MITKVLVHGANLKDEMGNVFQMRYSLLHCNEQDLYLNEQRSFGICVEKQEGKNIEETFIPCVSSDKDKVLQILHKLCEHQVTTVDSEMIVADMIDLY